MSQRQLLVFGCLVSATGVLLAGCSLPFGQSSKIVPPTGPQNKIDQAANATKMSVMMATGQAGTCIITNTADAATETSEIAVKGKKFRMKGNNLGGVGQLNQTNETVTPAAKKIGYMLNDGEYIYFWQESATSGMKLKIQPSPTPEKTAGTEKDQLSITGSPASSSQNPAGEFEADPKYRVDCKLGGVTDDVFVPPAQIKFLDFGQSLSFPGADKLPDISLPAGKKPVGTTKTPIDTNLPEIPGNLPADLTDDSGQ